MEGNSSSSSGERLEVLVDDGVAGGVSAVVDSRTGLFIRAHGVVFSTSAIISAIRIAHTSTRAHKCTSMSEDWQGHMAKTASNSHTNRHKNPELDSTRAKAVHGRRSLPAGPCRIVLVYHYLPCRCPPSSVVSGSYWELVLRIITCP